MTHRMVLVRWTDSAGRVGWMPTVEGMEESLTRATSVGYLVAEHEDRVVLAQSLTDDGEKVADTLAIPRSMVQSMDTLRRTGR